MAGARHHYLLPAAVWTPGFAVGLTTGVWQQGFDHMGLTTAPTVHLAASWTRAWPGSRAGGAVRATAPRRGRRGGCDRTFDRTFDHKFDHTFDTGPKRSPCPGCSLARKENRPGPAAEAETPQRGRPGFTGPAAAASRPGRAHPGRIQRAARFRAAARPARVVEPGRVEPGRGANGKKGWAGEKG